MLNGYRGRELAIRLACFVLGTMVTAVGASLFVLSATGTDPFGMLMQGVARTVGISNGVAHLSINIIYLFIILLISRKYVRIGTFAALFAIAPVIDLISFLCRSVINETLPYPLRLLITLFGCITISFGLSCAINAGVGVGANDIIPILLSDRLHIQFRWVRIAVDCAGVIIGFLLGGVIGPGTIIGALLTGPAAQFFIPYTGRALLSLLRRYAS